MKNTLTLTELCLGIDTPCSNRSVQSQMACGCFANLYRLQRAVCVKIVRRHHLTLHWVLTLSPLGCDTNKPGSQRNYYPRSSLHAGVSFIGSGLLWPDYLMRRLLVCLAQSPERENNNNKNRPLSKDQNTHKTNVSSTVIL